MYVCVAACVSMWVCRYTCVRACTCVWVYVKVEYSSEQFWVHDCKCERMIVWVYVSLWEAKWVCEHVNECEKVWVCKCVNEQVCMRMQLSKHVCMSKCGNMHACKWRPGSTLELLISHPLPCLVETTSITGLELTGQSRLAAQPTPRLHLSLPCQFWDCKCVSLCLAF